MAFEADSGIGVVSGAAVVAALEGALLLTVREATYRVRRTPQAGGASA